MRLARVFLSNAAMTKFTDPLTLASGVTLKNRFTLAPLTNTQSPDAGILSEEEFRWLAMRAQGGFGLTMTCAAAVSASGAGFPGQLGVYDDTHDAGLARLATAIKAEGSVAIVQLHDGGPRRLHDPVAPSPDEKLGARALSLAEIQTARDSFISAAQRAEKAGFDGVELHGAHGYLICAFLSPDLNRRDDAYGGDAARRAQFLFEIVDGVRAATKPGFALGVRLSPERWGLSVAEIRDIAARLMSEGKVDFLDISLWDSFKEPEDAALKGRTLGSYFTELPRGNVRLGAAGKIMSAADAQHVLDAGFDFVTLGRAAVLHHDFPKRAAADAGFVTRATPVSEAYLAEEGLSPVFVAYMRNWKGFVEDPA